MSDWLRSDKASRLFLYSTWIVVCLGIFVAFMATPLFRQLDSFRAADFVFRILGGALGIIGGPSALILLFSMVGFCLRHDKSQSGDKILWFIVFLITACFGAAPYFFIVYRKQAHGLTVRA